MPTLGLKPSRSSIINPNSFVEFDYCTGMTRCQTLAVSRGRPAPASLPAPRTASSATPADESLPVLHLHPQGSARRRRGREPPADDARRLHQAPRRRHLQLHADGPARDPQGRGDRPRGDEPRRRRRAADAGGAAGRAVAGERAASRSTAPSCCASRTATTATSSSSRPAKKSSPTSRARSCAATSSCRRISITSRPSSATSAGRASA